MLKGIIAGLAAVTVLAGPLATATQAQSRWFYDRYQAYDDQAYDDFDRFDRPDGPVFYDVPPPWVIRRAERRARLRAWARRQRWRMRRNSAYRGQRETLFEARQRELDRRYLARQRREALFARPARRRPTVTFDKVPLPREKPAGIVQASPVSPGNPRAITPDERPRREVAAPPQAKPKSAKPAKMARLEPEKPNSFQPLEIEVQPRTPPGYISCAKAKNIVAGFGFSGISARSCKGKVYSFDAVRDGKPYEIKLSARNGELLKVARR
ncbi:MAG TPA: hypothetical protein ENJ99_01485 [Rhizobiales bacterium]|nr:hypothetical protein [Hyphomicrobiales bacterium]